MKLFISQWDGRCDWLQLSTTSFEAFELEITENYPVHTWTENHWMAVSREISRAGRCLFGLFSRLSTRSSTATRRTRSTAAWLPDNCTRLADSLQQTVGASKFPTLVGQFTQQPLCTILLWQIDRIASSCEMFIILFNFFYWYLGPDSFPKLTWCTKYEMWENKNIRRCLVLLIISVPKILVNGHTSNT